MSKNASFNTPQAPGSPPWIPASLKDPFRGYARASLVSTEHDAALAPCVTVDWSGVVPNKDPQPSAWLRASHAGNHATGVPSQPIHRAADTQRAAVEDVQVHHRRAHIPVPKQFLHRADVVPVLE